MKDEISNIKKVVEVPFDLIRRKMRVIISFDEVLDQQVLLCKGASEEIIQGCFLLFSCNGFKRYQELFEQ